MKLQRERAAEHERLRCVAVRAISVAPGGSVHRSKCHWNHGPPGTRSRIVAGDVVPADLRGGRPRDRPAECLGQQLTAEAHTEQGHAGVGGVAHQLHLGAHPGAAQRVVVDGPSRAERDDDVVAGRVGEGHVDGRVVDAFGGYDLERVDVEALLCERLAEQGLGREMLVVEEQNLRRHARHYFGARTGGASSGASSAPILRNRVSAALG